MAVDREGGPQGLYKSFDLQRTRTSFKDQIYQDSQ